MRLEDDGQHVGCVGDRILDARGGDYGDYGFSRTGDIGGRYRLL